MSVCAISIGFRLVSLVTNRVSLEEMCLPSFKVLNSWLNLAARCLDDENEIPLKMRLYIIIIIIYKICLLAHGLTKISRFLLFMYTYAFLGVFIQSWQFRRCGVSFVEDIQYL